jgi:hypothetical protein
MEARLRGLVDRRGRGGKNDSLEASAAIMIRRGQVRKAVCMTGSRLLHSSCADLIFLQSAPPESQTCYWHPERLRPKLVPRA